MSPRRAIIDIGSNTVRLVMYGGPPRAPTVLHNEKVTAKLGKSVGESGLLSDKAMAGALAALARYKALVDVACVAELEVVATAAVRDAANGAQFLDSIRAIGLNPRLLSGEEEALTSAHGVIAAFPRAKGIVADLGGGSLELVDIAGDVCQHGISLPLGSLNLSKLRQAGAARFDKSVAEVLQAADLSQGLEEPLYLVGGSCRAFARFAMDATRWPLDDPHGFELDTAKAIALADTLSCQSSDVPMQVPGLSASRIGALPDVAALLAVLIQQIGPSKLVFSSWGLREGLIYNGMEPTARMQDPLLAGIAAFTQDRGSPVSLATMVAGWTARANPCGQSGRENLRLAATMLAIASLQLEPNLRIEHAVDWALRKRWIGIDCEGRAMMAAAILANGGRTSAPAELGRLAPEKSLLEAAVWGQAIRLCRRLTGGSASAISSSALGVQGDRLFLSVGASLAALFTETIEKELRTLAKMLDLKAEFTVVTEGTNHRIGEAISYQ